MSERLETIRIVSPVSADNPLGYIVINKADHKGEPVFGGKTPEPVAPQRRQRRHADAPVASTPKSSSTTLE